MKKFTIPCDFGGQKAPFTFYIGDPSPKSHPIHFQSDWLGKNRGGHVPSEVMEKLDNLCNLARKNNVSFEDLCEYALMSQEYSNQALPSDPTVSNKSSSGGSGSGGFPPDPSAPPPPNNFSNDELPPDPTA